MRRAGGDGITTSDENSKCAVLKVSYGEFDEVFGGDLTGYPQRDVVLEHEHRDQGRPAGRPGRGLQGPPSRLGLRELRRLAQRHQAEDRHRLGAAPATRTGIRPAALTRLHSHGVRTYWTEQGRASRRTRPGTRWRTARSAINAVWQPGGVDSVLATGIADTLTNSGTAVDRPPRWSRCSRPMAERPSRRAGRPRSPGRPATTSPCRRSMSTCPRPKAATTGATWRRASEHRLGWPWNVPNTPTIARAGARDRARRVRQHGRRRRAHRLHDRRPDCAARAADLAQWRGTLHVRAEQSVTWNASDNVGVDSVNVDYSLNGAAGPWQPVAHGLANVGSVSWTLPRPRPTARLVLVTAFDHAHNQAATERRRVPDRAGPDGRGRRRRCASRSTPRSPRRASGATQLRFSLAMAGPGRARRVRPRGSPGVGREPGQPRGRRPRDHWPGVRDGGAPAGTGIYFVRLTSRRTRRRSSSSCCAEGPWCAAFSPVASRRSSSPAAARCTRRD